MPSSGKNEARLRLRITAAAEAKVRAGHPWVFATSVRETNRPGASGELAVIYDKRDRFLAIGFYDPESPLRVRILHAGSPLTIDESWWKERLESTRARRLNLFDEQTTGYRCIHGESDGWPGLVLDRYGSTFVLKLYTASWLPRLPEIIQLLVEGFHPERVVLRLSRNIQEHASRLRRADGQIIWGSNLDSPIVFLETGLRFQADVLRGQKTGFFLDQRENRRCVEGLAAGRTVLNTFSFSGGFSLYAARGGASSVTDLDISAHALASAQANFALNEKIPAVASCSHDIIQADAFDWLRETPERKFGLVILDPPSLAKREAERAHALRAYGTLIAAAIKRLEYGGILVAASCSAHVTEPEFIERVRDKARRSERKFQELLTTGHPPDHPACFPEAKYLKCLYLKF
jgi:23S rRNA (cytosine1962-C5)-methyltransferase